MSSYQVILVDAKDSSDTGRKELKGELILIFGLSEAAVESLFKKLPAVLKSEVSLEEAEHFAKALADIGARAEVRLQMSPQQTESSSKKSGLSLVDDEMINELTTADSSSATPPQRSLSVKSVEEVSATTQASSSFELSSDDLDLTITPIDEDTIHTEKIQDLSGSALSFDDDMIVSSPSETIDIIQPPGPLPTAKQAQGLNEDVLNRAFRKDATSPSASRVDVSEKESSTKVTNPFASNQNFDHPIATDSWTAGIKKHHIGIAAAVVLLIMIAGAFFLVPETNGPELDAALQVDKLLHEQKKIKSNKSKVAIESTPSVAENTYWEGTQSDAQFSTKISLTLFRDTIKDMRFELREVEPAKLTPKQIVDNVPEPLWLDRFETQFTTTDGSPKSLNNFELQGRAYLRQRLSSSLSRRVVARLTINGSSDVPAKAVLLKWNLQYGDATDEIKNRALLQNPEQTLVFRYFGEIVLQPTGEKATPAETLEPRNDT